LVLLHGVRGAELVSVGVYELVPDDEHLAEGGRQGLEGGVVGRYIGRIAATVAGVLYTLSPIDLIPDFIPLFGQLDDIGVIILVVLYWLALRNQLDEPKPVVDDVIDIDPVD
jgi:hypothetical protein